MRGQREVEDDEHGDDEQQHRRQRVARPQLEQKVLARQRAYVGEVVHASASLVVASASSRAGSCVATTCVRSSRSTSSSSVAPDSSSAEYGSSSTSSDGSCSSTRQSARRCVIPREYEATRSWRTSHSPKRSSSIPIRSRRSGTR